jgi:cytoskeletal protein CcmA (bactofilin family)
VEITGDVGDVLRVGGGTVTVGGHVAGYLVAGGGTVELLPAGRVDGGVFVNAGRATVDGTVSGPLEIRGGDARINGTVEGDVKVYAGTLWLGERAVLKKDLEYSSKREVQLAPGAQVLGKTRRLPQVAGGKTGGALALLAAIASFAGVIVAGLAVVLLFRGSPGPWPPSPSRTSAATSSSAAAC